jgi:hypothetical protein
MFAYVLLLLAVVSRVVPHPAWFSFTAVGGSLLYFGARRSWWQGIFPLAVLAATDYFLTVYAYGYAFHAQDYLVTWAWYAVAMVIGGVLLRRRANAGRVIGASIASSTSFFLVSNFMVWMGSVVMYPHTAAGLSACYIAGLPFYRNDLLATTLVAGLAFGVPALIRRTREAHEQAAGPMAA